MQCPLVTLTTDFAEGSPYVACMKGVIWSLAPDARVADLSHSIRPQDVRHAAFVLWQTAPWFPKGTLHVVVVDPGVGTQRAILYAETADQRFVAPDNGVLSWLARHRPPTLLRAVAESNLWRQPVSSTFHGRDIMAPVAAHLALGLDPAMLGPEATTFTKLDWPKLRRAPNRIEGEVLVIDSFGNLITNIAATEMEDVPRDTAKVTTDRNETAGILRTYAEAATGSLVALIGSTDLLEIAVANDSAAKRLHAGPGTPVTVTW